MFNSLLDHRDQVAIQSKLQKEMERRGIDALLLLYPENVFYATGCASSFGYLTGDVGRVAAIVPSSGQCGVVCGEFEKSAALRAKNVVVESYPMWMYIEDYCKGRTSLEVQPDLNQTLHIALDMLNLQPGAKLGVESPVVPHDKWEYLVERVGRDNLVDCTQLLIDCKKVKTPGEIEIMRKAAKLDEIVMNRVMKATKAGMTEADVCNMFARFSYEECNEITSIVQVHTLAEQFGPSVLMRHIPLKDGDIVRLDGSLNVCCYGSDLARTFAIGDSVLPERQEIFDTLLSAMDIAFEMIGPGVPFAAVFDKLMKFTSYRIPGYIRGHFGHSISCNRNAEDAPMISNKTEGTFEPGMIFCVEFPYYSSRNNSFNIEDEILITENGFERFTCTNRTLFVK